MTSDGAAGGFAVVKRSVMVAGHRTSVSLEAPFWAALKTIAEARATSVQALVGAVDAGRGDANLSSALRVFVLRAAMERADSSSNVLRHSGAAKRNPE
jgi:predicted DNA-binding ribbon-helix-helix protein